MHPTFRGWLDEISRARLIDTGSINSVANANLLLFSTTLADAATIEVMEAERFILAAFELYRRKLTGADNKMCFYSWFDELAGQLRCSATLSNDPNDLPFACKLDVVSTAKPIAECFLNSGVLEGIPIAEIKGPSEGTQQDEGEFVLTVFSRAL